MPLRTVKIICGKNLYYFVISYQQYIMTINSIDTIKGFDNGGRRRLARLENSG